MLGKAETIAPTDLTPSQLAHARRLAEAAYRALRVEGLARVDVFLLEDDEIVVNEVNTMPGFTPISMFPMLWEAEGRVLRRRHRGAGRPGPGPPRTPGGAAHPPPGLSGAASRSGGGRPGGPGRASLGRAARRASSLALTPGSTRRT